MRKTAKTTTKKTAAKKAVEVKETLKAAAEEAVKTAEAVAEKAEETVEAAAEKAEEVVEAAAEKAETIAEAAAEKVEEVKEEVKKTVKTAKTSKTAVKEEVYLQYLGKEISKDDLMKAVKEIWTKQMKNKVGDMKSVALYLKPEENMAYYVINGEVTGAIEL